MTGEYRTTPPTNEQVRELLDVAASHPKQDAWTRAVEGLALEVIRLRQALEKRGKELLAEMQAKAELKADIGRRITKDAAAAPAIMEAANLLHEEGYHDEAGELEALL